MRLYAQEYARLTNEVSLPDLRMIRLSSALSERIRISLTAADSDQEVAAPRETLAHRSDQERLQPGDLREFAPDLPWLETAEIEASVTAYENDYGMSSDEFMALFHSPGFEPNLDHLDWAWLLERLQSKRG